MKKIFTLLSFLLPFVLSAQIVNTSYISRPVGSSPTLTTNFTSLSGFSTNSGTASTSQSFTLSGSNLTANASVGAPTNFEVSLNNSTFAASVTVNESGGILTGQPISIFVRIKSSASAGSVSGNVGITSTGAVSVNVAVSGTVGSGTPTLSTSGTLSNFVTTVGTASGSQSFTTSGSNLTTGATLTAPTGFEVSLDNTSFGTTKNISQSGGTLVSQPVSVFTRIAAATSVGSYSGNISIASAGATTVNVAASGVVNANTGKDSARFQFDTTASINQPSWTIVQGDPSKHILSGTTGNSNTITYTTVSISSTNWNNSFGGACMSPGNGESGVALPSYAAKVMGECAFTSNVYNSTTPQFIIGGLKTDGTTYDIQMSGGLNTSYGLAAATTFNVSGTSLQTSVGFQVTSNATNIATFATVQPNSSGQIMIYFGKSDSGQIVGAISWIILKEH